MTKVRPTSVTVFGILHVIFGIVGIMIAIYGVVMAQLGGGGMGAGGPNLQEIEDAITKSFPSFPLFNTIHLVLSFVFPIMLILAGILLLKSSSKGRSLSLAYALSYLAWSVVYVYVFVSFVAPVMEPFVKKAINEQIQAKQAGGKLDPQAQRMAESVGGLAIYAGVCCTGTGAVYPLVVLFCMFLPSMRGLGKDANQDVLPGPESPPDDAWNRQ